MKSRKYYKNASGKLRTCYEKSLACLIALPKNCLPKMNLIMMRLKLFSMNSVKAALLLFSFFLYLNLSGCQNSLEPTFKEEDIPELVKQICKDEYKLDVVTERTETTLWIYVPLPKILDKDYGVKEGKIFDEE